MSGSERQLSTVGKGRACAWGPCVARYAGNLAATVRIGILGGVAAGLVIATGSAVAAPRVSTTPFDEREAVQAFADELVESQGLDAERVLTLLGSVSPLQGVVDAISTPAERVLTWADYRPIFIKPGRIERGRKFLNEHAAIFKNAEARFGVPREIIAAIIGVETWYGRYTGSYQVLASLATLAFDYPPRADFFRSELAEFLRLTHEEKLDPQVIVGSYAGAMGLPQFISSSYLAYAIDFDGDGQRDLFGSPGDAIGSVANYLAEHGWQNGGPIATAWSAADVAGRDSDLGNSIDALLSDSLEPSVDPQRVSTLGLPLAGEAPVSVMRLEGADGDEHWVGHQNFYSITRYNHSALYAMAVSQLSEELKETRL